MKANEIGENAEKIVKTVSMFTKISISDLKLLTRLDYKNIFLALGWLSKDNKVLLFEDKNQVLNISLTEQ